MKKYILDHATKDKMDPDEFPDDSHNLILQSPVQAEIKLGVKGLPKVNNHDHYVGSQYIDSYIDWLREES